MPSEGWSIVVSLPEDQLQELKHWTPDVAVGTEGGRDYVLLPAIQIHGWQPSVVDLLLCPHDRDGYPSRLFTSARLTGRSSLNWNGEARLLGRNWFAFSYKIQHAGLRLAQILAAHLRAFR